MDYNSLLILINQDDIMLKIIFLLFTLSFSSVFATKRKCAESMTKKEYEVEEVVIREGEQVKHSELCVDDKNITDELEVEIDPYQYYNHKECEAREYYFESEENIPLYENTLLETSHSEI